MTNIEILRIPINNNGLGSIKVMKGFLKPGVYTYILQTKEQLLDSKKMIIK